MKIHKPFIVAEEGGVKFVWLGLDESDAEKGILTNQYLLISNNRGLLIDPGGYFVFERVFKNVSQFINPENVEAVFYSHQDPDITGSLNLILDFFPNAKIYVSALWVRFLPHLGAVTKIDLVGIPDEGGELEIGGTSVKIIPAHFLHSPGMFTLYVPSLKLLFSSDIGAAVFPKGKWYLFVEDFDEHVKYMEWFHKRYLACRKALDAWLKRIDGLEINIIAPQHGAIFVGENARRFIEWLKSLNPIGVDYVYS